MSDPIHFHLFFFNVAGKTFGGFKEYTMAKGHYTSSYAKLIGGRADAAVSGSGSLILDPKDNNFIPNVDYINKSKVK